MRIEDIKSLKRTVLGESEPVPRNAPIPKRKNSGGSLRKETSEFREAKAKIKGLGNYKGGTRKSSRKSIQQKTAPVEEAAFSLWLEDVDEAVDQFIGMPIDVLPRMPWKTWFKKGISAVVAAKNAVQMYEDIEEDEEEFEEAEDHFEEEEEGLDEVFGGFVLALPYHKWYAQIDKMLQKEGLSFEALKAVSSLDNGVIHGWYNANYAVKNTFKMIMETPAAKKAKKYTKGSLKSKPRVTESKEGYVDVLGVPMRVAPKGTPLREAMKVPVEPTVAPQPVPKPQPKPTAGSMMIDEANEVVDSSMVAEAAAACMGVISEEKQEKQAARSQGKMAVTVPNQQTGNEIVPKPAGGGIVENVSPESTESEEG